MNAQYMIVHVCPANTEGYIDSEYGVDCASAADVKFYGRTSVITDSVRKMLVDIAKLRSCVDLTNMLTAKQNGTLHVCLIHILMLAKSQHS